MQQLYLMTSGSASPIPWRTGAPSAKTVDLERGRLHFEGTIPWESLLPQDYKDRFSSPTCYIVFREEDPGTQRLLEVKNPMMEFAEHRSDYAVSMSELSRQIVVRELIPHITVEETPEDIILAAMMRYDLVVKMPPTSEYTVRARVEAIEKATPHVVEPEGVQ